MATYDERARNYATNARQEYLNSLSYLTDDLATKNQIDQQTLADKYNTLYEQIARQQEKVNTKFGADAQSAYLNKLMSDRALDEQLSQLGVSTQGFGVNQRMLNENAYGQNLAALQQQQSEDLGNLAAQLNDARGRYNVATGQLASDYLAQLANAKQTQQSMADKYYTQAYNNYLADLQYQDQMAQQQWERDYKARQLAQQEAQQQWERDYKARQLAQQEASNSEKERSASDKERKNIIKLVNNGLDDYPWTKTGKQFYRYLNSLDSVTNLTDSNKDKIKNSMLNNLETALQNNMMTNEEANLILYMMGIY